LFSSNFTGSSCRLTRGLRINGNRHGAKPIKCRSKEAEEMSNITIRRLAGTTLHNFPMVQESAGMTNEIIYSKGGPKARTHTKKRKRRRSFTNTAVVGG